MSTIDYRTMAEDWLEHVARQYERTHVCRKDLPLIEHLLKLGHTLIAVRDTSRRLRVDFLGKRSATVKESLIGPH